MQLRGVSRMLHVRPSIFRSFQACSVASVYPLASSRSIRGIVIEKPSQKQLTN